MRAEQVGWEHPDVAAMRAAQQAEIAATYGTPDPGWDMTGGDVLTVVLLRDDDGTPVACGALRDATDLGERTGELKRLFVVPARRGQGLARRVLGELEAAATSRGLRQLFAETGPLQPEAIGLYLAVGYVPTDRFPPYEDDETSRAFVKDLVVDTAGVPVRSARAHSLGGSECRAGAELPSSRPVATRPLGSDADCGRGARGVRGAAGADGADGAAGLVVVRRSWLDDEAVALRRAMAVTLREMYGPTGWFADDETIAASQRSEAGRALAVLMVRDGGDAVGAVTLSAAPANRPAGWGELERLIVLPAARGRGAARLLLRAAETEARARGLSTLTLSTGYRQYPAIRLYLSSGYRLIAPAGDSWRDQHRLFWFAKPL